MGEAINLLIPASVGELIDKITILEIKQQRIHDLGRELAALMDVVQQHKLGYPAGDLAELGRELSAVNQQLWTIEDEIRECERQTDFGPRFVELARAVYRRNDERAAIKRRMNEQCGSELVEEKSYAAY
jgi:cob(I)alamin adenosyltransferase